MKRAEILDAAQKCVCGGREQDYGSPEDSFGAIARLWSAYLSTKPHPTIKPKDVAAMMALLKIARIATGHAKEDNWVDLAGYAACGGEIEGEKWMPAPCRHERDLVGVRAMEAPTYAENAAQSATL